MGEVAVSDTLDKDRDEAWKVEMNSEPFDKLRTKMYFRSVGEDFHNPSMSGSETGTEKYGAELDYSLTNRTHLLAESFVQDNKISGTELWSNSLGTMQEFSRFAVEGGYQYLEEQRTDNDTKESQVVFAGIKGNITDKLDASLRRDQVISSQRLKIIRQRRPRVLATNKRDHAPHISRRNFRREMKTGETLRLRELKAGSRTTRRCHQGIRSKIPSQEKEVRQASG